MRLRLAAVLVLLALLGALRAAAQAGIGDFAPTLPDGIGDVSRWQLVTGDFDTRRARGEYRFYVNPARTAMYQLMRYRVQLLEGATDEERRRGPAERVAFVRQPGAREPMALWERQPPGADPAWREIVAGTSAYRLEMGVLMRVLGVHRVARTAEAP
jgi:hypothetical protein